MALTKVIGAGAEGLTLSSTSLTVANGLTLTDGNVTLADGHGIDFSATGNITGTSTELFDDYEYGSHTLTFPNVSLSPTSQGSVYTKIGNVVNFVGSLSFPSTSDSNSIRISLPFVSASNNGIGTLFTNGRTNKILLTGGSGQSNMRIYPDNSFAQDTYATFSGYAIYFTITYQTT